jgi:hypothetical protein
MSTPGEWNTLDRQAPIPYVRSKAKKDFEVPTIKFQFEREQTKTVKKETQDDNGVPTGTITETSTYIKDCKVTLKTFSHSSDEDGEHWIEALETLAKELEPEWKAASQAKPNDATVLFQAVDKLLLHSANAEWMDTLEKHDRRNPSHTDKTWEKFKMCVADFTTRVVFKPDAYDRQKSYLQERVKPYDLSAKEWSLRLETLSRMLPWLIPNVAKLQKETVATANWKDLWVLGYLSEAEKRRILFSKMPPSWHQTIQITDTSRELQDRADIATVTGHLVTLESLEKANRFKNTRVQGRSPRAGRISASPRFPSRQPFNTYGRYPPRQPFSGQQYTSNYSRYQPQQHMQSGGRVGYSTRPGFGRGRSYGRPPGGRFQYSQRSPSRGGRFPPRSFGGQRSNSNGSSTPVARPGDQYWQEEGYYDDGYYQEGQEQVQEEVHMTEEERSLLEQWNDNLFISSDTVNEGWYETQEQYAAEEMNQELYYGEEDTGSTSEYQDAYEEDPQYLQGGGW